MVALWSGLGGTYYYPEQKHQDQILQFLDTCREHGISRLMPYFPRQETIFRFAGPPSDPGESQPRKTLADYYHQQGWDPLGFLVEEAGKRAIAVQPYWAVFYAGVRVPDWNAKYPRQLPVLSISRWADAHPEMWRRTRSGQSSLEEKGYVILSPAFAEVRAREITLFKELVERYPLDGVTLEFLDGSLDEGGCTRLGYEEPVVERFQSAEGRDPFQIPNCDPQWLRERTKDFDQFLWELSTVLRKVRADLNISAVFTSRGSEREYLNLMQDWGKWTAEGWLDELCPWHRHSDLEVMECETQALKEITGGAGILTAVLGTWKEDTLRDSSGVVQAAQGVKDHGADRLGIYRADSVDYHGLWSALRAPVFREQ